jgi:hypothetical protein
MVVERHDKGAREGEKNHKQLIMDSLFGYVTREVSP